MRRNPEAGSIWRGLVCAGLFFAATASASTHFLPRKPASASPYDHAVTDRVEFEGSAAKTRAAYTHVLDEFRAIYHDDPRDLHAADAVYAVAELLAEQGRTLSDPKSLRAAIGQYEFLRTQYPASNLRAAALLGEAQIEDEDLGDRAAARQRYAEVLRESPRSASGAAARAWLATPTAANAPVAAATAVPSSIREQDDAASAETNSSIRVVSQVKRPLALVTGIRHWSTSTYTRVAIDLGEEVKFEAARVPNPDRIYFDLYGAKLGAELIGKSFDVTDDGFLKKIRAAQSSGDVTRVVLDVNDVTEYSAFLLPNPYRLIIDIHGRTGEKPGPARAIAPAPEVTAAVAPAAAVKASSAANVSGLPAMAVTDGGETSRPTRAPDVMGMHESPGSILVAPAHVLSPGKPVPNTVTVKAPASSTDVANVSLAPGRIDATNAPTSKPIASVVKVDLVRPKTARVISDAPSLPVKAADRTADGETSLVRALGLKIGRIVIDAGHGGHDSGTLGVDGIQEKDVVLDVALRLGKLLHERLGAEIIYTRSDDTFIPLETRTAIANKAQADLFLSIHANSSQDESARGVEVYYLNFTSDATALDVAARENAVGGQGIHQLSDLVKKIALKDKIAESREFAADVDASLYAGLEKGNSGLKNRGVKKAPFVVLIGANMPSILAEISFVTNGRDAVQLREPEYRERVAESLYAGVARYEGGLAGAKMPVTVRASTR